MSELQIPLLLSLFAGLATGIGSTIAFFIKKPSKLLVTAALGLSAGVLLYVSFMEMLFHSFYLFKQAFNDSHGHSNIYGLISFFSGMFLALIIDKIIPSKENPHNHTYSLEEYNQFTDGGKLKKVGVFTALAIAIHNFPEGLVSFSSATLDLNIGIAIAIAIAIHNIPEGIAVSIPIYFSTGSKKKAFWFSFLAGLSEPVGAVLGYFFLLSLMGDFLVASLFGGVAGMMVYIALDELLPIAQSFDKNGWVIYFVILGMMLMAGSLLFIPH